MLSVFSLRYQIRARSNDARYDRPVLVFTPKPTADERRKILSPQGHQGGRVLPAGHVLFFLAQGLSFTQIAILETLYNLTTLVGEIPTGYIRDRVGRRTSLLIGSTLIALTLLGIGLAGSFVILAGLYICWSMGYNCRSGGEDAWLYDTLTDDLAAAEFAHVRGRGESVSLAVGAGAAIVGGYLGTIDLSYPWFVAASVTALGVPVLLTVEEPTAYERTDAAALSLRRTLSVVRKTLSQRNIRAFVLYYYVLYAAVTYLVFVFLQPIFETVVLDFGATQSQVRSLLGWFYASYSLFGAGLSYYTGAIRARFGLRRWFLWLPFVVGTALIGLYFIPVLALPAFLLIRGLSDVTQSFAGQYVNDRIETTGRATVLSAMAMVTGLAVVPFQLGSGIISDIVSPSFALTARRWSRPVQRQRRRRRRVRRGRRRAPSGDN